MSAPHTPLNAVCPYFTMFPLDFPHKILSRWAKAGDTVLDPFCGRGTTAMAARLCGLGTTGIDSHPVAAAVTQAKLVTTTPEDIMGALDSILESEPDYPPPSGRFWELVYHHETLSQLTQARHALMSSELNPAQVALRAIILGALHGPLTKTTPSYLSNQCPRTYAPKPGYAIRFWEARGHRPPKRDLRAVVERRAVRCFDEPLPPADGSVALLADSRNPAAFQRGRNAPFQWVITSPPYYGMRTYNPDQWLRVWFLGGPDAVDYAQHTQMVHDSPESFLTQLSTVWMNCFSVCRPGARLVVRFGSFPNCRVDPWEMLATSLQSTGWKIVTRRDAGPASAGRRQAEHFGVRSRPRSEFDLWATA